MKQMKFIITHHTKRNEQKLPTLHFVVIDQWLTVVSEKAFVLWLRLHTLSDSPIDLSDELISLWEVGLVDIDDTKKIIVYDYPQNNILLSTEPIKKYRTDFRLMEAKEKELPEGIFDFLSENGMKLMERMDVHGETDITFQHITDMYMKCMDKISMDEFLTTLNDMLENHPEKIIDFETVFRDTYKKLFIPPPLTVPIEVMHWIQKQEKQIQNRIHTFGVNDFKYIDIVNAHTIAEDVPITDFLQTMQQMIELYYPITDFQKTFRQMLHYVQSNVFTIEKEDIRNTGELASYSNKINTSREEQKEKWKTQRLSSRKMEIIREGNHFKD